MTDIHGNSESIENILQSRFQNGNFCEQDKDDIRLFCKRCRLDGLSIGRIRKYISHLHSLADFFGQPYRTAERGELETLVLNIQDTTKWQSGTKRDLLLTIRKYYTVLSDEHNGDGDFPEKVDWIKLSSVTSDDKPPKEVLTQEEIKRMAEETWNTRDKALVLTLYESGCRIGEFHPLKRKELEFDKHGAIIRVNGKTGGRRIRLHLCVPALQRWIENHPDGQNPESYVWVGRITNSNPEYENKPLHTQSVRRRLRKIAEKAGVSKAVNPHSFRHARATHLANELTEAQMNEYFGWAQGSDTSAQYVHLSGRDLDEKLLEIHGIKDEENERTGLDTDHCPRCNEPVSPGDFFCGNCGLPADKQEETQLEELMVKFLSRMAEKDPEVKDVFREIVREEEAAELLQNR